MVTYNNIDNLKSTQITITTYEENILDVQVNSQGKLVVEN